ncbi:YfcE family phosphodiesterase [Natronomonas sp. CBA1123]|jgi:putative phosphoesterase|uniref:metallophosphoesterase n=1 Tax=Natronomonas sp. CBA1123 TaxID=2668070 RepID=UPI0012EAA02E|nr:metallophosphoesterase [Natronomonas sp. CBA1123]MUV85487.1 YfcE family phosphodiesterase [Natronomonas sp. CBA1123]
MLVVLSDTHGRDSTRLEGRTAEAVDAADLVIHAGDYMTETVLDAFEARCDLRGVYGNNDPPAVRERVPAEELVEWAGLRIAVVHGHEHTDTALSMLGRQANADLLVFGHSHAPEFREAPVPMLNPGSHADPRWNRPAHAELEFDDAAGRAEGRLADPSGEVFERFVVEPRPLE